MELLQQIFPPWHIALDMFLLGIGIFIFYKVKKENKWISLKLKYMHLFFIIFSTGTLLFLLFDPRLKLIYFKADAGLIGGYFFLDQWLLNPLQNTFN